MTTFRDIVAWQRGMRLAMETYRFTSRLPDSERFGLVAQMRRASVSVPCNIAESFGRESRVGFLRFLRIARGSLFEIRTQCDLCVALELAPADEQFASAIDETGRVLQAFIRGLAAAPERRPST